MNKATSLIIEGQVIDSNYLRNTIDEELKKKPDLIQLTFENNQIVDHEGVAQFFSGLKRYESLEGINFRQNNLTEDLLEALAEGIRMKKELRVIQFVLNLDRLWI